MIGRVTYTWGLTLDAATLPFLYFHTSSALHFMRLNVLPNCPKTLSSILNTYSWSFPRFTYSVDSSSQVFDDHLCFFLLLQLFPSLEFYPTRLHFYTQQYVQF